MRRAGAKLKKVVLTREKFDFPHIDNGEHLRIYT